MRELSFSCGKQRACALRAIVGLGSQPRAPPSYPLTCKPEALIASSERIQLACENLNPLLGQTAWAEFGFVYAPQSSSRAACDSCLLKSSREARAHTLALLSTMHKISGAHYTLGSYSSHQSSGHGTQRHPE